MGWEAEKGGRRLRSGENLLAMEQGTNQWHEKQLSTNCTLNCVEKKGKKHCVAYSELKKNFFGEAIIILTALTMT